MSKARRLGAATGSFMGALVVLAVACGTTVPLNSAGSTAGVGSPQGSGPNQAASRGGPAVSLGAPLGSTQGTVGGQPVTNPATGAGATQASTAANLPAGPPATTAAGAVTSSTVKVGIQTFAGYQQAAQALGAGAGGLANQTAEDQQNAQLVVNYLNAHGGIGGRRIVPIYHDTNIDSSQSFDVDAQASCAAFTQDNRVFAVITPEIFDYDTLMSCLASRHTPLLAKSLNIYDQAYANRYPGLFYEPADVFGNRWAVFIDSLTNQGFFGLGSRIGIIRSTWPVEARTAQVLRAELRAHGYSVVDEVAVEDEHSTATVGNTLSGMSAVELRFRSENINRILFTQGPVFPLGFMTAAETQGYFPKYGLTNEANLTFLQADVPSGQLRNISGITFADLPSFPLANAATRLCKSIGPATIINPYCGKLLLLAAALHPTSTFTPAGLAAAVQAIGSRFVSPEALATDFAVHYQDGADEERPFHWDTSCNCFGYSGSAGAVP